MDCFEFGCGSGDHAARGAGVRFIDGEQAERRSAA
jgi:hypothetical protein